MIRISMIDGSARSVIARNIASQRVGQIRAAKGIILCAGTIGTAVIALNSGMQETLPCVGKGLADHEIRGVRIRKEKVEISKDPSKLQCEITICGEPALLNVNANTFLGRGSGGFRQATQEIDHEGSYMDPIPDNDTEEHHAESAGEADSGKYDTVNITLEYAAELSNENRVLNIASQDPCIYIHRRSPREDKSSQMEMQELATYYSE